LKKIIKMKITRILRLPVVLVFLISGLRAFAAEPPFLGPIEDFYLTFGDPFYLNVDAKYADPPEVYELLEARPGMTIDPVSGVITWIPADEGDGGRVTVRAYNAVGSSQRSFWIYMTDGNFCPETIKSYWKLDETSGTDFEDGIGGFTASTTDPMTDVEGMAGRAKLCAPTDNTFEYISVPDQGQYDFNRDENFTLSMWFRYDGPRAGGASYQVLLTRGDPDEGLGYMFQQILIDETGEFPRLTFALRPKSTGPVYQQTPTVNLSVGEWTHMAFVYQGAAYPGPCTMTLYINGSAHAYSYPLPPGDFAGDGDFPLNLGFWSNTWGNTFPFNGALDEILIYDDALTLQAVQKIYNDGLDGKPACKKGNWFPYVTSLPDTLAAEDEPYSYTMTAADLDGGTLTMSAVDIPSWTFFDPNSGILSGTPHGEDVGVHHVHLVVSDGTTDANHRFNIRVTETNDPPQFTSVPITSCKLDSAYIYFVAASDPEGDELTFSNGPNLPSWLTFEPITKILFGIPRTGDEGDHIIQLMVSDGEFLVTQIFTLRVTDANTAPQIASEPPDTAIVGEEYTYIVQAVDNEGDNLTYSADLIPDWLEFNPSIHMLSGTPVPADHGKHNVILSVSDGRHTTQQNFTVMVVWPLGLGEVSDLVSSVYPNPARDYVRVVSHGEITGAEITDLSGKVLIRVNAGSGRAVLQLDVSELDPGLYMLRVFSRDQFQSKKLIIQ
jgi:hypothetical protein